MRCGAELGPGKLRLPEARDALYAWILARRSGGSFVVTSEHGSAGAAENLNDLRWLGLEPDEGRIFVHDLDASRQAAYRLLESGHAYRDFQESIDSRYASVARQHESYRSRDRNLSASESSHRARAGQPHTVRFKVSPGTVSYHDLVCGEIAVCTDTMAEFLLLLEDSTPCGALAAAMATRAARVDQVFRGEELLRGWASSRTLDQLLVHRALGGPEPRFGHLPRIRVSPMPAIGELRDSGFSAAAVVNWLAFMGWSSPAGARVMSRDDLVRELALERVGWQEAEPDRDLLLRFDAAHGGRGAWR